MEATAAPQHAMLSHYDTDMDGVISTKEFENGLSDDVSFEEALQTHIQADINGEDQVLFDLHWMVVYGEGLFTWQLLRESDNGR